MRFFLISFLVVSIGCVPTHSQQRYSRKQATLALERFELLGLELGVFPIEGAQSVIDGDTIRVKGLSQSLRLLGIDAEETFKKDFERQLYAQGWANYLKAMRKDSKKPVKMASPLGDEAKKWAQAFFEGVTDVKLERDHPGEIRDYYNRYLAYVFVQKNGKWVNYNVECVRAGMSPYFAKYGRSRRFHDEFLAAQKEARENQLGIWSPGKEHYDDYPERLTWWTNRGEIIHQFEREMETRPDYVVLTRWDAMKTLEKHLGKKVVLLGSVNDIRVTDKGPVVVKLGRTRGNDFEVVFFDRDVLLSSGILRAQGEYVRIKGVVSRYRDKRRQSDRLQMVVSLPGQVVGPEELREALEAESSSRDTPADADLSD